jgi:hypothetical protein
MGQQFAPNQRYSKMTYVALVAVGWIDCSCVRPGMGDRV